MSPVAGKVVTRYLQAQDTLDGLADELVDGVFSHLEPPTEQELSQVLADSGLTAEHLNSLMPNDPKIAGSFVHVLGGMVAKGLWQLAIKPFVLLGRSVKSTQFRERVKGAFKKALKKEIRSSRHMLEVATKLMQGQEVKDQEKAAAFKQLTSILAKTVLLCMLGPGLHSLFSGPVWTSIGAKLLPVEDIILVLFDKPIRAAVKKFLDTDV